MPENEPKRIAVGLLPRNFQKSDASVMIGLAASAAAIVAAIGQNDENMLEKLAHTTANRVQRMRPEAARLLFAVCEELVQSVKDNKDFMVIGGFEKSDG